MIRVLVVDDSPSVRQLLEHILGSDPGIEVVGCAADGAEALRMMQSTRPDVVTMDLHMPGMDGFEATTQMMQTCPVPIVIVSGGEIPGEVNASFRAIEAGALMAVQRPAGIGNPAHLATANILIRAVKSMAEVKVVRRWPAGHRRGADGTPPRQPRMAARVRLVLLGASTGGPAVLRDILAELPAAYPLPVVIVQHMSPGFEDGFAEWLSASSGFEVRIARDGDELVPGRAYVVPNDVQATVTRSMSLALAPGSPEHGMCPSVSHLFRSVHPDLCAGTVAVLLTGMGKDGAHELRLLKDAGALTIVQDRASCAVFGMPGEAIRQDAAKFVLAPVEIGRILGSLGTGRGLSLPFIGDEKKA